MRISAHRADHQHMLRSETLPDQRRIYHQRIVSMHKRFFTPRFPARGAQAAENDIDRINHLRQCIGQLRIVWIEYPLRHSKGTARWRSNRANARLIL